MDVSSIASAASANAAQQTELATTLLVMKKSMDMQQQAALQLLQALPQVASNPPNLGNSVDISA
ncbi:putative motility protein [Burkholderiaceae bacterium DAT-1]|nr:putative motility protein [Burkholderiaceae bacterium DAT-1]